MMSVRNLSTGLLAIIVLTLLLMNSTDVFSGYGVDLVQYWASAKAVQAGLNPYDPAVLFAFEQEVIDLSKPILMWNPPLILALIYPFGWFSFEQLVPVWFLFSILLVIGGLRFIWPNWEEWKSRERIVLVAGIASWYPLFLCLSYGQIAPIMFLGLVIFFYFLQKKQSKKSDDLTAGAALSLTFLKPHLLYLIYLAVLFIGIRQRRWALFQGILSGVCVLTLAAMAIQPEIFGEYFAALKSPPIHFQTPTLGSWLQGWTETHTVFVRMLPSIVFGVGALILLLFRKVSFQMLLLFVPVSMLSSPYGWTYDQILLMVPIFFALQNNRSFLGLSLLLCSHLFMMFSIGGQGMHYFVWYPVIMFVVLLSLIRCK